jgi:geranylgeranyl pyrophosphate synthase
LSVSSSPSFSQWLQARQQQVDSALTAVLAQKLAPMVEQKTAPTRLQAAMQYAVLGGGKRLRPLLVYAAAEALAGEKGNAAVTSGDIPACAVECIHAYSLIHDDLPAMDDDALRRGRPTCHIQFDEATAILAGDALQALAFDLLASSPNLHCDDKQRLLMVTELAKASGWLGMVAGQALDIEATGQQLTEQALIAMHALKTGTLISASVMLGALSTGLATSEQLQALREFAQLLGLAFQIQDDILDVEASTEISGKQQGKDAQHGKATYTSILGLAGAKQRLAAVAAQADAALRKVDVNTERLRQLAQFVVQRQS